MYVIKKGQYFVSLPGSKNSYTTDIRRAQIFSTREDAEKQKCGNETICTVASQLPNPYR